MREGEGIGVGNWGMGGGSGQVMHVGKRRCEGQMREQVAAR